MLMLEVVTIDRPLVHEEVEELQVPGAEGYFGVLPGHTPLVASLTVGALWYRRGTETFYLHVGFGFAEVLPDKVTILAEVAERPEEIDVSRAEASKKRAEERIASSTSEINLERAQRALSKAVVRLQVATRGHQVHK
jgi:F-type H+-transporting ATPase subunit epsilon